MKKRKRSDDAEGSGEGSSSKRRPELSEMSVFFETTMRGKWKELERFDNTGVINNNSIAAESFEDKIRRLLANREYLELSRMYSKFKTRTELLVSGSIHVVPDGLPDLYPNLEYLSLQIIINRLPDDFERFKHLETLTVGNYSNPNQSIDDISVVTKIVSLKKLDLSACKLTSLPASIGNLTKLRKLTLAPNELTTLPTEIGALKNLSTLDLSYNLLQSLPESIGNLTNLTTLDLQSNVLTSLPDSIGTMTNLQILSIRVRKRNSVGGLSGVPESLKHCVNLKKLDLTNQRITEFPTNLFENMTKLTHLFISKNPLTSLNNTGMNNLVSLERLLAQHCRLTVFPDISNLTKLKNLNLASNRLTRFEGELASNVELKDLKVNDNTLTQLPELPDDLETLRVARNPLTTISLKYFNAIEILDIEGTLLTELPVQRAPDLWKIMLKSTLIPNIDALNDPDAFPRLSMNRSYIQTDLTPEWLPDDDSDDDGRHEAIAFEVHNAFNDSYRHFVKYMLPLLHIKDTKPLNLRTYRDALAYARDQIAPTLDDTLSIKDRIRDQLTTLIGSVGEATLNSVTVHYSNSTATVFQYLLSVDDKRLTMEYLSRFTDECVNAYGSGGMSCVRGVAERFVLLLPEAIQQTYQQAYEWHRDGRLQRFATPQLGHDVIEASYIYKAMALAQNTTKITSFAQRWSLMENAQPPHTEEACAEYIVGAILEENHIPVRNNRRRTRVSLPDHVGPELKKIVIRVLRTLGGNFNCKERDEIFLGLDCEEGTA